MPSQLKSSRNVVIAALALMALAPGASGGEDLPDTRPATGPAAADVAYPHRSVRRFELGDGPRSYWLFEPAEPKPERAAVIVFLHGWFAVNPAFYGAWIDHLVRSGHIVVFPRYQNDVGTLPREFLPNAMAAIRDALGVLEAGVTHVRPEPARLVLIGHSAGGNLAAQIAAIAPDVHAGLPQPRAVIALMPGEVVPCREPNLDRIPASTLLIVAVGEDDLLVGDLRGRQIFTQASSVPRAQTIHGVPLRQAWISTDRCGAHGSHGSQSPPRYRRGSFSHVPTESGRSECHGSRRVLENDRRNPSDRLRRQEFR